MATVPAIGPAAGDVRLAAEADDAVPSSTALDEYARAVVEHNGKARRAGEAGRARGYSSAATEIVRPLRPGVNSTVPGRVAKIV